jgi:hypothetical protein
VVVLVGFLASFKISPSEFLFQMAAPSNIFWDHAGKGGFFPSLMGIT